MRTEPVLTEAVLTEPARTEPARTEPVLAQPVPIKHEWEQAGLAEPVADILARELAASRERSLAYTDADDDELIRQHSPLMSPLVWDLAHVGNYEELWLLRALTGASELRPGIDGLYDAFRHPRATRTSLPLLTPTEARRYIAEVRERALDTLAGLDAHALAQVAQVAQVARPAAGTSGTSGTSVLSPERLVAGGFVHRMVVQHEHQHAETMLATHQLRDRPPLVDVGGVLPAGRAGSGPAEVLVPAGEFTMGTSTDPWAYDNERPAHRVHLPAFWIDRLPVSNAAHAAFVEAGGYDDERLWSPAGWGWRSEAGLRAPEFWHRDGGSWVRRRFGHLEPVPMDEPVQHVSFYEAQAHARWAGKRLPTEPEWEKACAYDPVADRSRRYPWGDSDPTPSLANLGHRAARPAPSGAYPAGASAYGVEQLIGDVWEWTSTEFASYPGFGAFPYREYSEVFFPDPAGLGRSDDDVVADRRRYRVLRGGSWATHPRAVRSTFRNWDYPIRRQIFVGFRLARTAG